MIKRLLIITIISDDSSPTHLLLYALKQFSPDKLLSDVARLCFSHFHDNALVMIECVVLVLAMMIIAVIT